MATNPPTDGVHLVGFAEIGAYLREAREALTLPIERPVRDLHLRLPYLQAIEEGRPEALPGQAYARGYAKNYADYLGVDTAMILQAYDRAVHFRDPVQFPAPTRREARPNRALLVLCAIGLLLFMGAWRLFSSAGMPGEEHVPVAIAAPVSSSLPKESARNCWSHLPTETKGPACYSAPAKAATRPSPTMRYGTELQLTAGAGR